MSRLGCCFGFAVLGFFFSLFLTVTFLYKELMLIAEWVKWLNDGGSWHNAREKGRRGSRR